METNEKLLTEPAEKGQRRSMLGSIGEDDPNPASVTMVHADAVAANSPQHRLELATDIVRTAYAELGKEAGAPLTCDDFHAMYHTSTVSEYFIPLWHIKDGHYANASGA